MNRADRLRMRAIERNRPRRGAGDVALREQAMLREDLGFKMTGTQYDEYLAQEQQFQDTYGKAMAGMDERFGSLSEYDKKLAEAEGKIAKAYGEVGKMTPENVWNQYRKSWIPVTVTSGNVREGTYYLPQDIVAKLNSETFNQGEGSYMMKQSEADGQWYVDTLPAGTSNRYGKELHEALAGVEGQVYNTFMHGYDDVDEQYTAEEAQKAWKTKVDKAIEEGRYNPDDPGSMMPDDLMFDPSWRGDVTTTHYEGQAAQIRQKQAAARAVVDAQRDIIAGKRAEYKDAFAQAEGQKAELEQTAKWRQEQKDQLAKQHKESVAHRKQLFALGGK